MRLLLDEDVDVLLATLLSSRGFDCLTVRQAGRLGISDEEQIAFATSEDRVLLTHNGLDFEALATEMFSNQQSHAGILIMHRRVVFELAARVTARLGDFTQDQMRDRILRV